MAVWSDCATWIADRLRDAEIPGLAADPLPVYEQTVPRDDTELPCIVVHREAGAETIEPHSFGLVQVTYPVGVLILATEAGEATTRAAHYDRWRDKVGSLLRVQKLPGVDSVWQVRLKPQTHIDRELFRHGVLAGGITVNCLSIEPTTGVV